MRRPSSNFTKRRTSIPGSPWRTGERPWLITRPSGSIRTPKPRGAFSPAWAPRRRRAPPRPGRRKRRAFSRPSRYCSDRATRRLAISPTRRPWNSSTCAIPTITRWRASTLLAFSPPPCEARRSTPRRTKRFTSTRSWEARPRPGWRQSWTGSSRRMPGIRGRFTIRSTTTMIPTTPGWLSPPLGDMRRPRPTRPMRSICPPTSSCSSATGRRRPRPTRPPSRNP